MGYLTLISFCLFVLRQVDGYVEHRAFTKEPALWSLRCLYAGEDKCKSALTDYELPESQNTTFQDLEDLFADMNEEVQKAFIDRDLGRLSNAIVCHIPKPLLLLLPEKYISSMRGDALGMLLECYNDDIAVVRLVGSTIENLHDPYSFYSSIQSQNLEENVVSILGDEIKSMSSINSAQWLVSKHNSVLEYLSPDMILNDDYSLFQWMRNIEADGWVQRPQRVKRIWAYALKHHILPRRFSDWDDSELQSMGHLLVGSTVQELKEFSPDRIVNRTKFFQLPFSVIQIRGLFDRFNRYQVLYGMNYEYKGVLHQLLPKHLQQFYETSLDLAELSRLREPTSIATSRQIVEFIVRYNKGTKIQDAVATKEGLIALNELLYCLPVSILYQLNYTLSNKEILRLQHHKLSLSQIYALTSGGDMYQLSLNGIDGANDILRGLPTALLTEGVPSTVYVYLMSKLPCSVPPRTAALLDHLIFKSGKKKNFRSVFENKDAKKFLSFLPTKYIEHNHEYLLPALKHHIDLNPSFANDIPEQLLPQLSILLTKVTGRNFTWSSLNPGNDDSRGYSVLMKALTCADVNKLSPLDFIHVMSHYNSIRLKFGWTFPRNLQQCSLNKFVEYLEMKSAFMTHYLTNGLTSLMTSSDVEAIGGFVLAGLPMVELRVVPERDLIIKAIGQLSGSELLVAAPLNKLTDIGGLYFRPKMGKDVFNLGNLTAFLAPTSIEELDPGDFKLMLESGILDRRLCIPDNQRDSWSKLILEAFGSSEKWEAQDLVTLGDMLLVIPHHELTKVDPRVWADAADIIANTGYFEVLNLVDEPVVFYELCKKLMKDTYEATTFTKELSEYVGWLLTAAQYQMESVLNATSKTNPLSKPIASDDSFDLDDDSNDEENTSIWSALLPFSSSGGSDHGLKSKVSCDALRIVGKPSELYITTSLIDKMETEEVENCKEEFAKMDLNKEVALQIWNKLDKKRAPHLAGKLLSQASPTDLIEWDLSFDDNWAHETIYYLANYNHNNDTISALIEAINKNKLDLLEVEQVVALGPLTCQVSYARVTELVFFEASRHLGATLPCDIRCLQFFEPSFQNVDAYGPISEWSPEDVESLGIFIAGLKFEDWMELVNSDKQLLSRIRTRTLACLPKTYIQALTESAVRQLPTTTATLLSYEYAFLLNSTVKTALEDHLNPKLDFHSPDLPQVVYVWEDKRYVPKVMESSGSGPLNHLPPLVSMSLLALSHYMFL